MHKGQFPGRHSQDKSSGMEVDGGGEEESFVPWSVASRNSFNVTFEVPRKAIQLWDPSLRVPLIPHSVSSLSFLFNSMAAFPSFYCWLELFKGAQASSCLKSYLVAWLELSLPAAYFCILGYRGESRWQRRTSPFHFHFPVKWGSGIFMGSSMVAGWFVGVAVRPSLMSVGNKKCPCCVMRTKCY